MVEIPCLYLAVIDSASVFCKFLSFNLGKSFRRHPSCRAADLFEDLAVG
jgi:hypothetical protein